MLDSSRSPSSLGKHKRQPDAEPLLRSPLGEVAWLPSGNTGSAKARKASGSGKVCFHLEFMCCNGYVCVVAGFPDRCRLMNVWRMMSYISHNDSFPKLMLICIPGVNVVQVQLRISQAQVCRAGSGGVRGLGLTSRWAGAAAEPYSNSLQQGLHGNAGFSVPRSGC